MKSKKTHLTGSEVAFQAYFGQCGSLLNAASLDSATFKAVTLSTISVSAALIVAVVAATSKLLSMFVETKWTLGSGWVGLGVLLLMESV